MTLQALEAGSERVVAEQTMHAHVTSLRKTVLLKTAYRELRTRTCSAKAYSHSSGVNSILLATAIKEEEEEGHDTSDHSRSPRAPSRVDCHSHEQVLSSCQTDIVVAQELPDRSNRVPFAAIAAVSSVAAAAGKLLRGILPRHHSNWDDAQRSRTARAGLRPCTVPAPGRRQTASLDAPSPCKDTVSLLPRALSSPALCTASAAPSSVPAAATPAAAAACCVTGSVSDSFGMLTSSDGCEPLRPPPHLVAMIDGDDVDLALRALQLSAHIYDRILGPHAAVVVIVDPRRHKALLETARPLYDEAYAAACAIHHQALRSLVKEVVRRYVNPCRGSPDDVLRVILELLTGAGGAAAAASSGSGYGGGDRCYGQADCAESSSSGKAAVFAGIGASMPVKACNGTITDSRDYVHNGRSDCKVPSSGSITRSGYSSSVSGTGTGGSHRSAGRNSTNSGFKCLGAAEATAFTRIRELCVKRTGGTNSSGSSSSGGARESSSPCSSTSSSSSSCSRSDGARWRVSGSPDGSCSSTSGGADPISGSGPGKGGSGPHADDKIGSGSLHAAALLRRVAAGC